MKADSSINPEASREPNSSDTHFDGSNFDFSQKGVYCLIFENHEYALQVGKKGEFSFKRGYHIYVGSALGPGGLKRMQRHIRLSRDKDKNPKWHVDYLHFCSAFRLVSAVCAATPERLECMLAGAIGGPCIPGFGCTDCKCRSHLFSREKYPLSDLSGAFEGLGLRPFVLEF
ncbi:Endonuclease III [Methanosarcina sp. MTP4]|uniref:GIY-YIG nuclease family protein n=1 Tax=Methanosarcina sp. MTP4 TaxID=1434100 RepID=UPI000615EB35|nr:DUF123 domain-containing protein [Methanosarcina sp. MTP4]AKB24022.1 Endonuclease III [Methanosarcina sp. MTP4]